MYLKILLPPETAIDQIQLKNEHCEPLDKGIVTLQSIACNSGSGQTKKYSKSRFCSLSVPNSLNMAEVQQLVVVCVT